MRWVITWQIFPVLIWDCDTGFFMPIPARYFDGRSLTAHAALVQLDAQQLTIEYAQQTRHYSLSAKRVCEWHAPRLSITFADKTQLDILHPPPAWLHQLQNDSIERALTQWQQHRGYWLALAAMLTLALYATAKWTIPLLTYAVIAITPDDYLNRFSQTISAQVMEKIGEPSALCASVQNNVRQAIRQNFLPDQTLQALPITLHFRSDLGVNALALPDGSIILTDELLYFVHSPEELYGIVGHEIGHVRERHTLHMLVQQTLLTFFWDTITGDLSGTAAFASTLPLILQSTAYSRRFERAADDYAIGLMQQHHIDTHYLADFFIRMGTKETAEFKDKLKQAALKQDCEKTRSLQDITADNRIIPNNTTTDDDKDEKNRPLWDKINNLLASHPSDEERIARIMSYSKTH
jgi:Zn-dependent protease with chaperone function